MQVRLYLYRYRIKWQGEYWVFLVIEYAAGCFLLWMNRILFQQFNNKEINVLESKNAAKGLYS